MSVIPFPTSNPIECRAKENFPEILPQIASQLNNNGHCLVQSWETTDASLMELARCFGEVQSHIRANPNGIAPISTYIRPANKSIDLSCYKGINNGEFSPHTDGTALKGIVQKDHVFKRVDRPELVILLCVRPALKGGTSVILDTQKLLIELLKDEPEVAQILSIPGCICFYRDDLIALDSAIFERSTTGYWGIRYRADSTLLIANWADEAFRYLHNYYFSNPQYQTRLTLKEGQMLILDNLRVLHGRDPFDDVVDPQQSRLLKRIWINHNKQTDTFINFANSKKSCRALERYKPYGTITTSNSKPDLSLQLGIHLPPYLQAVMDKQISSRAA